MSSSTEIIQLSHVSHTFYSKMKSIQALKDISITIREGELIAVVGHSGSGKSTLFHIMGCLLTPTKGRYQFMGENTNLLSDRELATLRSRKIGFVFQKSFLISRMNVLENLEAPFMFDEISWRQKRILVDEVIERLRISSLLDQYPHELSGGQQQMVSLARAIVKRPAVLLADEPTANLDSESESRIVGEMIDLNRQGMTTLVITHNMSLMGSFSSIKRFKDGCICEEHNNAI